MGHIEGKPANFSHMRGRAALLGVSPRRGARDGRRAGGAPALPDSAGGGRCLRRDESRGRGGGGSSQTKW